MRDKILTVIFYPFIWLIVHYFTLKSVLKHYRFFKEHHPDMDAQMRQDRIIENVVNDMNKFRRSLGIPDSSR